MHEMSVIMNLFEVIEDRLKETDGEFLKNGKNPNIRRILLKNGKLSNVVADALLFAFEIAREGTIFENAEMIIEEVPVKGKCRECGKDFPIDEPIFLCPQCGGFDIDLLSGNDLIIESFEMEATDNEDV